MSRSRFNDIWHYMRWTEQQKQRPPEISSKKYRWLLVDDFIERFSEYRDNTSSYTLRPYLHIGMDRGT
jgi:hypothetical protein